MVLGMLESALVPIAGKLHMQQQKNPINAHPQNMHIPSSEFGTCIKFQS